VAGGGGGGSLCNQYDVLALPRTLPSSHMAFTFALPRNSAASAALLALSRSSPDLKTPPYTTAFATRDLLSIEIERVKLAV